METLPRTTTGKFIPGFIYSPETLFQPGQEPANKGQRFPGTGNSASFRKGHLPHNTKNDQDITIRTNKQGNSYKFIRLELDKWEFLQKHNWMQANGPIPKDKVLACKNGDTMNCDPENWELITRAELSRRNRQNRVKEVATCVCGKSFEMAHKNQRYCSKDCQLNRHKYTDEPIVYIPIPCVVCGNDFTPDHHKTKICSHECQNLRQIEYNNRHKSKLPVKIRKTEKPFVTTTVKICIVCDNAFFPASNVQKTCSEACQTIHRHTTRRSYLDAKPALPPKFDERHCSKCGQNFQPLRNNHSICSGCKTIGPRQMKCIECGTEFTKEGRGVQLLCSDNCQRLRKNRLRGLYGYNRKQAPIIILKCRHCGGDFEARNGSFYCSDKCKKEVKLLKARNRRADQVVVRPPKAKTQVTCTCEHCNQLFRSDRKVKYCSDQCRIEVKRESANKYNRTQKKLPSTRYAAQGAGALMAEREAVEARRPLNKRNPKAERDAVYAMLELNRNAPVHDREILVKKKIKSPDLSKIEYKYYDKRMRITHYFRNEERYLNFLKTLQNEKS